MTTDDLIQCLAEDRQVDRRPFAYLWGSLLFGVFFVVLFFFAKVGFRQDIVAALGTVRFLFKFVVIVPLAVVSIGVLFRSSLPVLSWRGWSRMLPIPVILLGAGVIAELMAVPPSEWMTRLIGSNSVNCMTIIPVLGIGPLAAFILALKHCAPANPGLSGAMAGLAASSIAASFYAMNCFDDSPLFVVTWYPLAIGAMTLAGCCAGLRYLRW
jgi:hypothetical protein